METTLDIRGLPEERVEYLKELVALWKRQGHGSVQVEEEDVKPADFIVRHSDVKGGRVTRAMAYE